jgi:hypothetical protein
MKLITETNYGLSLKENDEKELFIYGLFSKAETENANGRKYTQATLEKGMADVKESLEAKRLFGELNHGTTPETIPENIAILVERLEMRDNEIIGKAKVLANLPKGKIVAELVQNGSVGISSKAIGSVNDKTGYVNEDDYTLLQYDVVLSPSTPGAYVKGILEGKEFEFNSSGLLVEKVCSITEERKEEQKQSYIEIAEKIMRG